MTKIANIKQVMQSDREKVNIVCIYEVERIICRAETRAKNCVMTSNRKSKNTYGTAAAEALDLGSTSSLAMSLLR